MAVNALTSGIARLPERVAASASAARSYDSAWQAFVIGAAALAGITPVAASARASAASKSSMFCRYATSSQTARMAALESIGARRGERSVLIARDLIIPACPCQSQSGHADLLRLRICIALKPFDALPFGAGVLYWGSRL